MSTKVVSAPAKIAKPLVHKGKSAKPADHAQSAQDDDAKVVGKEARATEETAKVILAQADDGKDHQDARTETSSTSMAGNFSFTGALASAAATSGSLITTADGVDSVGFAQADDDGNSGGVILLVGAVALVGLGIAVLAGGGNGEDEVLNVAPVFGTAPTVTTAEDTDVTFTVTATDADGNPLTYTATATNGTVTGGSGGAFTFSPNDDFNGTGVVTVSVSDGQGGTTTQTVNVTVTPVNDAPVAATPAISVTGDEDTAITVTPTITDVDTGDTLTYTFTDPANGSVALGANGTLIYTGDANYNGTDSFVVTATDSAGASVSQTVNLTIAAVNDAPVAATATIAVTGEEGDAIIVTPTITDVDGDELTYTTTTPTSGDIVINDDGTLTYTPDMDFIGTDSFVVTATDPSGATVTQTVNVTVTEVTGPAELTIDVPPSGNPVTIDVSDDAYVLTDDVDARTDVILTGFTEDDLIAVTGAAEGDYSFGTSPTDSSDLRITFNDGTNFTQIVIDDVLTGSGFVFDYDSAAAAVGFDFMTFA